MTFSTQTHSRRAFLQRSSSMAALGLGAPLGVTLAGLAESAAAAASASDYKALVCVYLQGGNDNGNTLVPYDLDGYTRYRALRPKIALSRTGLAATELTNPIAAPVDRNGVARSFALAPGLAPLKPLFDSGNLAVLLNIGTLIQPTTVAQYLAKSAPLPQLLFSHPNQTNEWQADLLPNFGRTGWGGRFADQFVALNGAGSLFTCVNTSSTGSVFLTGKLSNAYTVGRTPRVPTVTSLDNNSLNGSATAAAALRTVLTTTTSNNLLCKQFTQVANRAINASATVNAALKAAPTFNLPSAGGLGDQLEQVARLISIGPKLGVTRQVFFVCLSGFDTHNNLSVTHPKLMANLGVALAGFYASLSKIGMQDAVATFTLSEFGRTMVTDGDGSQHGWGGVQFVMGGAVKGRQYYGTPPVLGDGGPDDIGGGRFVPTLAVDQLTATLGTWFGVADQTLLNLIPTLRNFPVRNLGFI